MSQKTVGKIRQVILNQDDNTLDVVIRITDSKFKRDLLKDLMLKGFLSFNGDELVFESKEGEDA